MTIFKLNKKTGCITSASKTARQFLLLSVIMTLTCGAVFSQPAESVYTRFGLGEIVPPVFSANKGMGYLSAPYQSAVNINTGNPASYASLTRTTIEAGVEIDGNSTIAGDSTYRAGGAGLSHFVLAFVPNPKHNNYAICMGLLPYSVVNYNFQEAINDSVLGQYYQNYTGSGQTYQLFLGGAYKVKGFAIGVNLGYIFGNIQYDQIISFPDSLAGQPANALYTRNITTINVKAFNYNVGIQYQLLAYHNRDEPDPRKDIYVFFGADGASGTNMITTTSNYWDRYYYNSSGDLVVLDTLLSDFNIKGKITLPYNLSGGVMVGNERYWMIGADFKYANWSSYTTPLDNGSLTNSWQASLGFQITPKYDEVGYLNRIQYRLGAYYSQTSIIVNGINLSQAGATFGLGFPLKNVAHINFMGDFGTIEGASSSIVRENYYKFTIGFVLNDIWFVKRKFD